MFTKMFCAEQIQVPPDLPAILKAYCKVVIKDNPADIISFSVNYFKKQLEDPPNSAHGYRVTMSDFQSLQKLLMEIQKTNQELKRVDYQVACEKLGFCPDILANILRLGFPGEDIINIYKFMGIGATLLSSDFDSTIANLFKIFEDQNCQSRIPTAELINFVAFLADKDPSVPKENLEKLKENATEEYIDTIGYKRIFSDE